MPYRLPAHVWRGLLSRAAMLEARAEHLGAFSLLVDNGSTVVDHLLAQLHLSASHGGEAASDRRAIAEAERRWQDELERACATPRLTVDEVNLLQRLSVPPGGVASADPFDALYRGVVERAAALYGAAWPQQLQMMLLPLEDHPRTPADAYAVSGQTRSTAQGALVELHVHPDGFGPATYLAIPVVLAHECVCHVVPCAMQQPVNSESAFAEGLMDWTSLYHVQAWMPQLCPAMAGAARTHAQLFSAVAVPRWHRSYSPRRVGWQAAQELVGQLMRRERIEESVAEGLVASLAVRMNVSSGSSDARHAIVQRIEAGTLKLDDPALRSIVVDGEDVDTLF